MCRVLNINPIQKELLKQWLAHLGKTESYKRKLIPLSRFFVIYEAARRQLPFQWPTGGGITLFFVVFVIPIF